MPRQTVTQFSVPVYNEPGMLAKVTGLLAREGINISAIATEAMGDTAFLRIVVDREGDAKKLLQAGGVPALETQVFRVELVNRPGELHRLATALAEEDVNVLSIWGSTSGEKKAEAIVVVDNPVKALPIVLKFQQRPAAPSPS